MFVAERGGRMPESYGARLRQQREERGIALAAIAKQTRIKESLLEALERDDLSQWPSGFYRRAFFRSYATAICLDQDVALQEFLQAHPEPPEIDVLKAMATALERGDNGSSMTAGFRDVVGSAIGSLSRLRRGVPGEPPAPATTAPEVPPALVVDVAELVQQPAPPEPPDVPESATAPPVAVVAEPASSPESQPVSPQSAAAPATPPDLLALAALCTDLARVDELTDARVLLPEAARLLHARGLIVWLCDEAGSLAPALVHGYSERVLAHLPTVRPDDDNATAAAFRTRQTRVLGEGGQDPGALVVPLLTPTGCAGVLAVELRRGTAPTRTSIGIATILAAQLSQLADRRQRAEAMMFARVAMGGAAQTV
jgi:hypothetical protein